MQAAVEVPKNIIESYVRLKQGTSLQAEQDWEQLISFAAQQQVQQLINPEELLQLNSQSMIMLSSDSRLILMKWRYESSLFELGNWVEVEEELVSIAAFAEDAGNQVFYRWALSRLAYIHWINGDKQLVQAYIQLAERTGAEAEPWFQLFKEAVMDENGPYKWFQAIRKSSGLEEAFDFISLPNGEWLSIAIILEKSIMGADSAEDPKNIFVQIDRLLPENEFELLAPYLASISLQRNWNLNNVYLSASPSLEYTKKWLNDYQVIKAKWEIELDRYQQLQKQINASSPFYKDLPIPLPWLIGIGSLIGVLLVVLLLRKRTNNEAKNTSKIAKRAEIESEPKKVQPTTKEKESIKDRQAKYEAPPKLIEESIYENNEPKKPMIYEPDTVFSPPKKYTSGLMIEANSIEIKEAVKAKYLESDKAIKPIKTVSLPESSYNRDERVSRLIKTLEETEEGSDFDQIWAMIERFIKKEFSGWFEAIEQSDFELTDKETRYLSMFMLNFSNELISSLAQIKPASIRGIRSRIRKKLGVSGEVEPHEVLLKEMK